MREVGAGAAPGAPIEVWFQDEMRLGQKATRVRAKAGSRPRALRSDGYQSVDLFGAVGPSRDLGCALILPRCDAAAMALFPGELSSYVAPGAHAVVGLDGAGWHRAGELRWPANLTPPPLPSCSPELNPQERVWAFPRQHHLARRRFLDHTALLDACKHAWRRFIGEPERIRSLGSYARAIVP